MGVRTTTFEVETYTVADGWVNCWCEDGGEDGEKLIFDSLRDAKDAIKDFFDDLEHAAMLQDYDECDYRILKTTQTMHTDIMSWYR